MGPDLFRFVQICLGSDWQIQNHKQIISYSQIDYKYLDGIIAKTQRIIFKRSNLVYYFCQNCFKITSFFSWDGICPRSSLMGLICKVSQWSHIRLDAAFFGFAKDLTMESEISTVVQHHSGSEGRYNLIDTISIFRGFFIIHHFHYFLA